MNTLLIYPQWPDTYWSFRHALPFQGKRAAYPPLGLITVASMLPAHWNKRLVDSSVRSLTDADLQWADIAMLSGMLIHKPELIQILERCRKAGVRTVIGGPVTSSVEELRHHADHVVIGEAEDLMPELVHDLENHCARRVYHATELPGLDKTPLPDLRLIKPRYYSTMAVQYSRGCPFNCEFCDIIEIYGRRPRTKPVDQVIAELEQLYAYKWRGSVFFVDDNFIGNKRNVKQLLPVVAEWNRRKGMPFQFFTEASINLADDEDLLRMMRDAGFFRVFVGIETPDEESLKVAQKMQNTKRNLLDCVRHIQAYGIEVMAGFIVGFDSDTEEVFDKQVDFIQKSAIPLAMVGLLQALPGTQLYRRLVSEGRLVDYGDGDNMSTALNFLPKMDAQRLVEGYRSILKRIYDHEAYYERVREFLKRYNPTHRVHHELADYVALVRSMLKQGLFTNGRIAYWKLFFEALTQYPRAFGTAITLAIMGYHFQTITERVCDTES
ncbi:MAG: B12-binding domain-containing radical SAM protein [Terriglobales bacterium]